MAKHNKSYKNANEMARRKSNWNSSKWKVAQLNSESQTATFDMNSTSDMDDVEYLAMLGLDKNIELRKLEDVGEEFVGASTAVSFRPPRLTGLCVQVAEQM